MVETDTDTAGAALERLRKQTPAANGVPLMRLTDTHIAESEYSSSSITANAPLLTYRARSVFAAFDAATAVRGSSPVA